MRDFDEHFEEVRRDIRRGNRVAGLIMIASLIARLFWMGFAGSALWLLGRWLGVW